MGYTAWEKVRRLNRERFRIDSPRQPEDYRETKSMGNIEKCSIGFVRDMCEELRFDPEKSDCGDSDGNGIRPGLIPCNMEKDNDRLCLERAIHRFMQSGTAEDAFDVYVCYLEMFVGKYGKTRKMIETLAEFEMNASSLLLKHRDHYSHSVYVFLLGLAIYYNNRNFRDCYRKAYGFGDERRAAHHYLKFWGLTSLFHDIGYPFELPFEQVKSYFGNSVKGVPSVSYRGMKKYVRISGQEADAWRKALDAGEGFLSIDDIFAWNIEERLGKAYGKTREELREKMLGRKASRPKKFNGYMDHAYFSGVLLYHQLRDVAGIEKLTEDKAAAVSYLDAMTAVSLHNSLFRFGIKKERNALPMELHPLAYMLMLCDELQCWDRAAYGQNSRRQLYPMGCDLAFDGNTVIAAYAYDARFEDRKEDEKGAYAKMRGSDGKFLADIKEIVALDPDRGVGLKIQAEFEQKKRDNRTYLSDSDYVHFYNFAIVVHGRKRYDKARVGDERFFQELEDYFDELPLEYKMSGFLRTKSYARYLNALGYFYTDRCVDYEMIDGFLPEDRNILGRMEHDRWNDEKHEMGWCPGTAYLRENNDRVWDEKEARELTRTHADMDLLFKALPEETQNKDTDPLYKMLRLLEEYDGLRIYRIPGYKKQDG